MIDLNLLNQVIKRHLGPINHSNIVNIKWKYEILFKIGKKVLIFFPESYYRIYFFQSSYNVIDIWQIVSTKKYCLTFQSLNKPLLTFLIVIGKQYGIYSLISNNTYIFRKLSPTSNRHFLEFITINNGTSYQPILTFSEK